MESLQIQAQATAKQLNESILSKEEERKALEASVAGGKSVVAELKSHVASLKEAKDANQREEEAISSE